MGTGVRRDSGSTLRPSWREDFGERACALAWSADGRRLAIGTESGTLLLHDGATGRVLAYADNAHSGGILALAWNPQLHILASSGADNSLRLWQESEDHPIADFDGGRAPATRLAWSADGRRLAIALGPVVVIADAMGHVQAVTQDHASPVVGLAWCSEGRRIATACAGGVHVFDSISARKLRSLATRTDVVQLAASPDGRVLAGGCGDNSVRFWTTDGATAAKRSGYAHAPRVLAWRQDSRLLATSGSESCLLWHFDDEARLEPRSLALESHPSSLVAAAFSRGGPWLATSCEAGQLCTWDPARSCAPLASVDRGSRAEHLAWRGGGATSGEALAVACDAGKLEVFEVR